MPALHLTLPELEHLWVPTVLQSLEQTVSWPFLGRSSQEVLEKDRAGSPLIYWGKRTPTAE